MPMPELPLHTDRLDLRPVRVGDLDPFLAYRGRDDVARNDASAGLLRRFGMRQEAHFIRNEYLQGEWCDELVFAMLADEWAARG